MIALTQTEHDPYHPIKQMISLYDHQKKIVIENKSVAGIFTGTGSGKSRIALLLAKGDTLVVAPKTQKEDGNWEREQRLIIEERVQKYKVNQVPKTFKDRLTVVSKEEFRRDFLHLSRPNTLIVDEAHTCLGVTPNIRWRNKMPVPKASQLFEALEAFVEKHKPERIYLCTATILRSPMTVWAAAKILKRLDITGSFYNFRERFYVHLPMPGREVWTAKKDDKSKNDLALMVRQLGYVGRLEDFVDMPEQVFKTEYVELTPKQKERIKHLPLEFPDPLTGALKKHCVENGVLNGDEFNEAETFENQKIDKIIDYSIEFPQLVIFARYKAQIAQIKLAVEKTGKKVFVLTGDTKNRGELLKEAQSAKEYVFICQSQVSAGWELPLCPTVIFASLDFSIVNLIQAQGRISRINHPKRNLYIYLVVKNGVDEQVYRTVVGTKMDFHLAQFIKT